MQLGRRAGKRQLSATGAGAQWNEIHTNQISLFLRSHQETLGRRSSCTSFLRWLRLTDTPGSVRGQPLSHRSYSFQLCLYRRRRHFTSFPSNACRNYHCHHFCIILCVCPWNRELRLDNPLFTFRSQEVVETSSDVRKRLS